MILTVRLLPKEAMALTKMCKALPLAVAAGLTVAKCETLADCRATGPFDLRACLCRGDD
jgi:hypothetical protein